MKQQTLSDIEYANRRRITKREDFLRTMDELIPWEPWVARIRPHYYSGRKGRRPRDLETMLRMYLLKHWYTLSDEGIEDAINDSYAMREFMRLDFLKEQVPDASTLMRFRALLRESGLEEAILSEMDERIREAGFKFHAGVMADASLIRTTRRKPSHQNEQ